MADEFEREFEKLWRRVKELERRTWEYIEDEIRRTAVSIREEFESIRRMLEPSWSHEGFLRPLYTVRDEGNAYVVYIDLPKADEGTIDIRFRGNRIFVRARLKEEVVFHGWSSRGGEVRFNEYRDIIELPVRSIDPNRVKVITKRRVVKIIIPKEGVY